MKEIGKNAFENCFFLRTITLSEAVTAIESEALCIHLEESIVKGTLTTIGKDAFKQCGALKQIPAVDFFVQRVFEVEETVTFNPQ